MGADQSQIVHDVHNSVCELNVDTFKNTVSATPSVMRERHDFWQFPLGDRFFSDPSKEEEINKMTECLFTLVKRVNTPRAKERFTSSVCEGLACRKVPVWFVRKWLPEMSSIQTSDEMTSSFLPYVYCAALSHSSDEYLDYLLRDNPVPHSGDTSAFFQRIMKVSENEGGVVSSRVLKLMDSLDVDLELIVKESRADPHIHNTCLSLVIVHGGLDRVLNVQSVLTGADLASIFGILLQLEEYDNARAFYERSEYKSAFHALINITILHKPAMSNKYSTTLTSRLMEICQEINAQYIDWYKETMEKAAATPDQPTE